MGAISAYDFVVIGAGSAGCAVAAGLADANAGSVAVTEAGPTDVRPFVKVPFALIWLMRSRRDWQFKPAPQNTLNGRQINVPRGKTAQEVHFQDGTCLFAKRRIVLSAGAIGAPAILLQSGIGPLDDLHIDFNLLSDPADMDLMVAGVRRLRKLLKEADIPGVEGHPGAESDSDAALRGYIKSHCGTAYQRAGTLRMGEGDAPVTPRPALRGFENLWVAGASVMPAITSANTNAPSMMVGHRAGKMIAKDAA
ncbi:GMC oxidoreductase [Yoonia sp.]|uniref:GMC oxidoreductase n=1 Tax=Yoonia sp. TaxID=2212373 RepID=UPI0035C7FFAB